MNLIAGPFFPVSCLLGQSCCLTFLNAIIIKKLNNEYFLKKGLTDRKTSASIKSTYRILNIKAGI